MLGWEIHERLGEDALGEWAWVQRGGSYRQAPERAIVWRLTLAHPEHAMLFLEEEGFIAERLGGVFQRVLERGLEPQPYFVLEPLEGVSLRSVLERGPLTPAEAVRIGLVLVEAAASAHALRAPDGGAMPVYGVGIGVDAAHLVGNGVRLLNPRLHRLATQDPSSPGLARTIPDLDFLAPEQGRGQPVVAETDVYSIALVVLSLCLGRSVLHRDVLLHTLGAVVRAEIEHTDLEPLPAPLRGVLLQALDREPNKRPFSPTQLAARLLEALPDAAATPLAPLADGLPSRWLPGLGLEQRPVR